MESGMEEYTSGYLIKQLKEIVEKLLKRLDYEFQIKEKVDLDPLFETQIKLWHVFSK